MTTLKPCPFCSGKCDPQGWSDNCGRRGPECEGCGATADSVEDWNARAGNSPQDIAQFLISTWVEENGCPIPWSGSVCITAIVTGMPDSQRDALLALYAS